MINLAKELTESGQYVAVMLSVEVGAAFPHDPQLAQNSILNSWWNQVRFLQLPLPNPAQIQQETGVSQLDLQTVLQAWSIASALPLVVFVDEIDALSNETLISVLRQFRALTTINQLQQISSKSIIHYHCTSAIGIFLLTSEVPSTHLLVIFRLAQISVLMSVPSCLSVLITTMQRR